MQDKLDLGQGPGLMLKACLLKLSARLGLTRSQSDTGKSDFQRKPRLHKTTKLRVLKSLMSIRLRLMS
jgi:hypothetical protein